MVIMRTCAKWRRKPNIFQYLRCIFIIASVIMDSISCAPNDNGAWNLEPRHYNAGEGIEQLRHLLFCTKLELERERANAETQSRLQEAKLRHLQELLTVACRERDEAREQLFQLNRRLAEYSMRTNTQQHVISSDRSSKWPNTRLAAAEPDELIPSTITTATTAAPAMHSNSSQLVRLGNQFRWDSPHHDFDYGRIDLRPDVDLHQPPTSSSKVHCSNLIEFQEPSFYQQNEHLSFIERERDQPEQQLSFVEQRESDQHHQVESHLPPLVDEKSTDYHFWQQQQQQQGVVPPGIRQPSNPFLGIAEQSAGSHMTYQDPKPALVLPSPPSILSPPSTAIPAHLPEPPESDLQVMLSTLPERGKLLQAVMQAGPLLQTLLMAGPLPQWIYPPPTLDTAEIPILSMSRPPNSLPVGPMVNHIPNPNSATAALNPLLVNSHQSLSPRTRINEPQTSAFIPSLQSSSVAASTSSKLFCTSMFNNSQDSAITAGRPLKFAKIH